MKNTKPTYRDFIYVAIQIVLFITYVLPITIWSINLPVWLSYSGLFLVGSGVILGAVALLQINTKLSPFPTPVTNSTLITNGAFAIARHPIYTAILLATLGYGVFQQSVYKIIIFLLLLVLFYFKSNYEEQLLTNTFSDYKNYKKRVGRLFFKL